MSADKLEKLYAEQIKPLPAAERLRLLAVIARDLAPAAEQTRSIMELEGLGADIWQGVEAQQYVDELRAEWERQPE
jgi:hypothetical protein